MPAGVVIEKRRGDIRRQGDPWKEGSRNVEIAFHEMSFVRRGVAWG
jgi:hypothetical protein